MQAFTPAFAESGFLMLERYGRIEIFSAVAGQLVPNRNADLTPYIHPTKILWQTGEFIKPVTEAELAIKIYSYSQNLLNSPTINLSYDKEKRVVATSTEKIYFGLSCDKQFQAVIQRVEKVLSIWKAFAKRELPKEVFTQSAKRLHSENIMTAISLDPNLNIRFSLERNFSYDEIHQYLNPGFELIEEKAGWYQVRVVE